jgi:signal transduction histidine kinase
MSQERKNEPDTRRASAGDESGRHGAPASGRGNVDMSRTGPISLEQWQELAQAVKELEGYVPVPAVLTDEDGSPLPHWRVRLDLDVDPPAAFGFDIFGPLTMGREPEPGEPAFLDLSPFDAVARGVSRRHLELRPAPHGLFAVDLNSLNGTYKNGVRLKPNSPTPLGNRDTLSLGLLHITVDIVDAPHQEADWFARQATLGQALTEMAKTVTTQLKVEDVLNTVVDYAIGLVNAKEATLWLLQPDMRELRLEAARGLEPYLVKHAQLPIAGSAAGQAILTGMPQVRVRAGDGKKVVVLDDYLVDSVVFVPLALGGLSLGVLSVSNSTPGHDFTDQDVNLLLSLADFAAIALQNSRTLEATDAALRESLRAQREATSRALESTRLKTEVLATVSHELRAPLHTITGFAQLALRGSLGELTDRLRDALERILGSGQQLLQMVDDLLESMRNESKEAELAHEAFSPRALVEELVESQMPLAHEKNLILNWSADPDVPNVLMGDPRRVYQVILNLVGNALKYTNQGGVSVQVRVVGNLMWSVSVADTGPGVAPEHQKTIFERFRQVEQSPESARDGVGLGLAIASDFVRLMGGKLRVTSEGIPGRGSIFTMTLPLILPGQAEPVVGDDTPVVDAEGGEVPDVAPWPQTGAAAGLEADDMAGA